MHTKASKSLKGLFKGVRSRRSDICPFNNEFIPVNRNRFLAGGQ